MDYRDLNDYELLDLIKENNEDAINLIHEKYKPLILKKSNSTFKLVQNKGVELADVIQECMIGFEEAINNFNDNDNVTFYTFVSLCMDRQLASLIKKLGRDKYKPLNDAIPLESSIDDDYDNLDLINCIENNDLNPEVNFFKEEDYSNFYSKIYNVLNDREKKVLTLKRDNYSYKEIASILNISLKCVDNTLQRIRYKVKNVLENK